MEIKIEKTKTPKAKPVDETKLGFGHIFTDHMFVIDLLGQSLFLFTVQN